MRSPLGESHIRMLLIGLTTLLIAIPLYSSTITPTLLTRITSITLLFSAALSLNALYVQAIGSGLGLYSGLFHVTSVSQAMEVFLFTVGGFILLGYANETSPIILNNGTLNQTWRTAVPSIAEYPLIVLFTTIGASFLLSSADLVSMYLSIELQSFAVYILAAIYRNSESATSAGLKYFLLGALSSALILLGSSVIYAYTGLTNFEGIYMINNVPDFTLDQLNYSQAFSLNSNAVVLGVLIIGVGFLFKVAAAPFHNWAPDVYDGVPTIVTTWLTVMPKISIFVFLLELGAFAFLHNNAVDEIMISSGVLNQYVEGTNALSYFSQVKDYTVWKNLLLTTSLFSLVIGTVVGLAQYRLKRLLAFSTISHVGFLLLALSVNSEESFSSFIFYLIQYSVTNLNAFFVLLAFGYAITYNKQKTNTLSSNNQIDFAFSKSTEKVIRESDITFISELKGQFHANPVLGLSLAVCLFSMAGIPPLMGFFAKYMVLYSAIENGYYFLALVGILASVVSAAYYLRIIRVIHFDIFEETSKNMNPETNDQGHETAKENVMTSTHSYVIAVLTLSISLFLLSPSLLLNSSNLLALSLFTA